MKQLINAINRIEQGRASPEDLDLIMRFASQTLGSEQHGLPVADKRLFHLVEAVTEIASALERDLIAQITAARALDVFPASACVLLYWDEHHGSLTRGAQESSAVWNEPFQWPDRVRLQDAPFLRLAMEKQDAIYSADSGEGFTDFFEHSGVVRVMAVPITTRDATLGLLVLLQRGGDDPLRPTDQVYLQLLGKGAAVSLENARLYEAERQHAHELEAVYNASLTLTASLDLQQVLDAILQSIFTMIQDAKDAHVFLYDGRVLQFGAALWWNGRRDMLVMPRENGLTSTVARRGETIVVTDMQDHDLYQRTPTVWNGSIVGLPLKIGTRVVGVLNVARVKKVGFRQEEMRLLRLLADQAAMAIENARLHDLIRHQALTDPLTGLPNRRFFDQRLNEEIRRSMRYQHPFVLMIMDLNGFKEINDRFGHPAGDSVLKQLAALFRGRMRDTDFLARYGGDEFAFILPETSTEEAKKLIQDLQKLMRDTHLAISGGEERVLSGCFGFALFPSHASSSDELISVADQMLYVSKHRAATLT